ncbi:hypothetical protein SELMODRAFT_425252 [Selaginella moellendorffii]|uniref:Uncharacterized protein n=1 Tax=Selaginella moellendorffii TaxID=88036 RepID=D8SSH8_SELML|nr:hypothetical protein SELMODRAFT_425252 [Selaginella moellendorffii]
MGPDDKPTHVGMKIASRALTQRFHARYCSATSPSAILSNGIPQKSELLLNQKHETHPQFVLTGEQGRKIHPLPVPLCNNRGTNEQRQQQQYSNKEQIMQLYKYLSSRGGMIEEELACRTSSNHAPHNSTKQYATAQRTKKHFEMWMAIILTTDDLPCMDNARTRKGRAAAHVEFDDTTAILAAQALAALAFGRVVDSTLVLADKRLRLVKKFSLSMQRLVYGQYDDVKKGEVGNTRGTQRQEHQQGELLLRAAAGSDYSRRRRRGGD